MNFFGHAAVATWSDRTDGAAEAPVDNTALPFGSAASPGLVDSGFVLGAMLPDFESMCGARLVATSDRRLEQGIELHHKTDAVFHRLPVVTGLMRELDALLAGENCARGPRRAVAHIGMELLLDGALLDETAYRTAYLRGIQYNVMIDWRDPGDAVRFATLLDRLRARGVPDDLRSVDAVAIRLQRILGPRPLLAPSVDDQRAIHRALTMFQPRLEVAAASVMRAMQATLNASV